MVQSNSTFVLL